MRTRSAFPGQAYSVVNRVVIEELEAWFFGDWAAVKAAFPRVPDRIARQQRFQDPDAIQGGTFEAMETILRRAGHFAAHVPKLTWARGIAPHMDPARNTSHSFKVFHDAILDMIRP